MRYVVIGNGVSGIEAAVSIRKFDREGTISLISSSPHSFYYRPKLSEYLKGGLSKENIIINSPAFFRDRSIDEILGTTVTAIRPESHKIELDTSKGGSRGSVKTKTGPTTITYDRLLLATGSRPFLPPIPGIHDPCVFSLRTIADAQNIVAHAKNIDSVTIIGGGLLGLEMGHYLRSGGKSVTVIEHSERLLPNQLDEEGAEVLQKVLEEKTGIRFQLHESITGIEPTSKEGKGEGDGSGDTINNQHSITHDNVILCGSGRKLTTDMVLTATGIRSRVELAQEGGLATNRGIVINDFLQTSDPDIFSAGDACEHNGKVYGIWPVAKEQGRIAGHNMTGVREEYLGSVPSTTLKVPGINLFSAGDFNSQDGEVYVHRDEFSYRKLVVKNGLPVGVIALGDAGAMVSAMRVIDGKAPLELLLKHF